MTSDLQDLLTELGTRIERLIERRVSARMAAARAALLGEPLPLKSQQELRAAGAKNPGGRGTKHIHYEPAYIRMLIEEAKKPGAVMSEIERREGLKVGLLGKWKMAPPKKLGAPPAKPTPGKRRVFTPEFKRELVAKAKDVAPKARGLMLHNAGIGHSIFGRWVKWVKRNPG